MAGIAKCKEKFSFSDIFETFHTTLKLKFRSKFAFFHRWCKLVRERKGFSKPSTPYNHSFALKRFNPGKSLGNLRIKKNSYKNLLRKLWVQGGKMMRKVLKLYGKLNEFEFIYISRRDGWRKCDLMLPFSLPSLTHRGSSRCLRRALTGVPARGFFTSRINM